MIEVLRENDVYVVELETDDSEPHEPHRSWGTYRVIDRRSTQVLFETTNRDKSFVVFEYLSRQAARR